MVHKGNSSSKYACTDALRWEKRRNMQMSRQHATTGEDMGSNGSSSSSGSKHLKQLCALWTKCGLS